MLDLVKCKFSKLCMILRFLNKWEDKKFGVQMRGEKNHAFCTHPMDMMVHSSRTGSGNLSSFAKSKKNVSTSNS